jgi:excisionase family DNA binding protein
MNATSPLPPAFSVPSLARRWEVSEGLIRKMIERGELLSFRLGVLIRVPASEVQRLECLTRTASNASEADMPSSGAMSMESGGGEGSTPRIDRARRQRPGVYGNPATIHRGPWAD